MRRSGGFTLVELVVALAMAAVLLGGIASAVVIASRGLADANDAESSVIAGARVVNQMCGELETAVLVSEQTATSIAFTVPARGTDTHPELIRYSWAGAGAPLLRQYNGGAAVAVLDSVSQLSFTPVITTCTESYPGVATEDANESLLVDLSASSGLGNQNVSSSTYMGQYFAPPTWGAGVVAWRPTRVALQAKVGSVGGTANVMLGIAGSGLTPLDGSAGTPAMADLGSSYAWLSYGFASAERISCGAGVCVWVAGTSGSTSAVVQNSSSYGGMLKGTSSGTSWNYDGGKALCAQLYGKVSRSGPTQYATSRYLSAITIQVRSGRSTNPAIETTAQTLNHPELLSACWEAKFDKDPTKLDVNGDGVADWGVNGGGAFTAASLNNGVWLANGGGLVTQGGDDFARMTMIDVRGRATSTGSSVGFGLNAARSGATCAPVGGTIKLMADGTQTLTVWRKVSDGVQETLLSVPGLPALAVDVHLVIDPASQSVGITVNQTPCGSFAYSRFLSSDGGRSFWVSSSGTVEIGYLRVREVQP